MLFSQQLRSFKYVKVQKSALAILLVDSIKISYDFIIIIIDQSTINDLFIVLKTWCAYHLTNILSTSHTQRTEYLLSPQELFTRNRFNDLTLELWVVIIASTPKWTYFVNRRSNNTLCNTRTMSIMFCARSNF